MEYFININNEKRGPYRLDELAGRGLDATSLVMADGSDQWIPAWQVDELRPLLMKQEAANSSPTPSETAEDATEQQDSPAETTEETVMGIPNDEPPLVEARPLNTQDFPPKQTKRKKNHTGCLTAAVIAVVGLFATLVFSCPDTPAHKEALANAVTNSISMAAQNSPAADDDLISKAFQTISNAFTGKVIEAAVDNLVKVDNHVVYSVGKVNFDGKDHVVSVGILGHIFTMNQADLNRAAEKYYDKAELKAEEELKKQAEKALKENIVDPAADAIKEMIGSVAGGLLDDLGLGTQPDAQDEENNLPADSI